MPRQPPRFAGRVTSAPAPFAPLRGKRASEVGPTLRGRAGAGEMLEIRAKRDCGGLARVLVPS